jgi:hypothetical protein
MWVFRERVSPLLARLDLNPISARSGPNRILLHEYPNVMAWIEQVESRETYKAST